MTSTEDLVGTNSCVDEARTGESVRKKQSVSGYKQFDPKINWI